jgi:hypothetical protein
MKCFVLGLDGIEYDFVEAWNLKNLMQVEYGKIQVPLGKDGIPTSPQVWSSFLTGKVENITFPENPLSLRITEFFKNNLSFLRRLLFLERMGKLVDKRALRIRGILNFDQKLKNQTFLDIPNSKAINVPFVNHDNLSFQISHRYGMSEISLEETIELSKQNYFEHKKLLLNELDGFKSVDLGFVFMRHIDQIQHLCLYRQEIIKELYQNTDYFVASLKEKLMTSWPDSYFIIVSDHGFNLVTGMHSTYAFYSSNIPLDPTPKKITDFYNILTSLANAE